MTHKVFDTAAATTSRRTTSSSFSKSTFALTMSISCGLFVASMMADAEQELKKPSLKSTPVPQDIDAKPPSNVMHRGTDAKQATEIDGAYELFVRPHL